MNHTPGPWQKRAATAASKWVTISGVDYDFAVRCVNERPELLSSLRAMITATQAKSFGPDTLEDELDELLTLGDAIDAAQAVLAKATS